MTQNNQTQDTQADLNKSQQLDVGASKQGQTDQTLNQAKPGQEDKTFQSGQSDLEARTANPDIEDESEVDDETDDAQSETTRT